MDALYSLAILAVVCAFEVWKAMAGGNSHQRAMERANKTRAPLADEEHVVEPTKTESIPGKPDRLNVGDSIGFSGILLGVLLVIIVPPLWIKIPLMFSVCLGIFLFVRRAHWTHGWLPVWQYISASVSCAIVLAIGVPQFISQWRQEHNFPLSIQASLSVGHQDNQMLYGIKWKNIFSDVRLEIKGTTEFPIHDLDLTVQVLEGSEYSIWGMGQVSDIVGVEFHGPEWPATGLVARGSDSDQWYHVEVSDVAHLAFGNHWEMLCRIVPTGVPLRLAIAFNNGETNIAPKKFKVLGTYWMKTNEVDRVSTFERVVTVH
jgi:hypothetical protein